MICTDFGLVTICLPTPIVRSWWSQWVVVMAAHHRYLWWRWRCDTLCATLITLWLHLLLCYLQTVVVEISPQLHSYIVQVVSEYLTMLHNTYACGDKASLDRRWCSEAFPWRNAYEWMSQSYSFLKFLERSGRRQIRWELKVLCDSSFGWWSNLRDFTVLQHCWLGEWRWANAYWQRGEFFLPSLLLSY
jgi:hypothetical protein